MPAPKLGRDQVQRFLEGRFGAVSGLERLGGGFWSAAFSFRSVDRQLVVRFGSSRAWFEADRAAVAFDGPDLPVPEVTEIGEAFGGAYAISVRHDGRYLELVPPDQSAAAGPMLERLLVALCQVPKGPDMQVGWHWQPSPVGLTWRCWLVDGLDGRGQRSCRLLTAPAVAEGGGAQERATIVGAPSHIASSAVVDATDPWPPRQQWYGRELGFCP